MTPYKGVIFDLDGTLLDTVEDIADSVNLVLRSYNMPQPDLAFYRRQVGAGLVQLLEDVLGDQAQDNGFLETFKQQVRKQYQQRWNNKTRPYEGINELLARLQQQTVPRAVLSNKYEEATKVLVDNYFLNFRLNPVLGARSDRAMKPDPAPAGEIAQRLQLPPEAFIYLGDTATDMLTAKNAGMLAVGVAWGFRPVEELKEAGADNILQHPSELLPMLRG